jgi:hypothetical protein
MLIAFGLYYVLSLLTGKVFLVFIFKCIICVIVPNLIFYLLYKNTEEFNYFKDIIVSILKKIFKKRVRG